MSRTYRRTQKGRKATWLPEVHSYDIGTWYRMDLVDVNGCNIPKEDAWYFEKNPHRISDIDDSLYHYNCCGCSWCLHEKKHRVLREIAEAEMKAAREGRDGAYEILKPKKTKKYRKPFEVWKRRVNTIRYDEKTNFPKIWNDRGWYRIGRYKTREIATQVMKREERIWKEFETTDYWYRFEIREIK